MAAPEPLKSQKKWNRNWLACDAWLKDIGW